MRQPELLQCSKESFFRAMLDLSSYGLEPDGRRAHLIPFWNNNFCVCGHSKDSHHGKCDECGCQRMQSRRDVQLIIDYKGLAELVRRSGDVSYIHADVVYENDEWEYSYGSNACLKHKPSLEDRGARRVAFYSFVRMKDGCEDFVVLSPSEVDKIRQRSKAANNGPWKTDYDEMGKKTAFRRHSKWLPLSPEVKEAVEHDDEAIDVSGLGLAETMQSQASVSLDQFTPSQDTNRGHDAASGESSEFGNIEPPVEVDELPDVADAKEGEMVRFKGNNYRFHEEASAWRPFDAAPTAKQQTSKRTSQKGFNL